jgi:hypothetical protein
MGADIHGVVERRVGEKWVAVRVFGYVHQPGYKDRPYEAAFDVALSRNYRRFAALAGVRGVGPEPRGIPSDASETTAFLIADDGDDGHSHSWLPLDEAAAIFGRTEPWPDGVPEDGWPRAYPASLFFGVESESIAEHRLVFWFDN